ncbi:alpha/beta fold hydrolase [Yoonia litorea]|uniref:Pimeloyl-ACP methyl ester carboxylesterase n=1 Tax=Yoonia litorea TaxID=1123755 RepID=A0A1I6MHC3_9RHOB|nr:alpha/beta hydrolase [Yoonia litorea]SFS15007.1 Pimeloyl-ACP methyl ester carboxylesterase [Yoonia litorea]
MSRETLVMLPPVLCDARVFFPQIEALSRDHAVMVAPTDCGERMEEIASQILSWTPSKFSLLGVGFGGMVAMEIMRRAPERITRIALVSTTPQPDSPERAAAREEQIIAAKSGRWDDVLQHEINSTWMGPSTDKAALVQKMTQMGQDVGPDAYIKQARAMQRRRDQQDVLRKIAQPAVVICGSHDGQYHIKRHQFLAELIPNASLEVIEGAGYLPTLERPEATTDALHRWIRMPLVLR